jgi:hypothetical protein
MNKNELADYLEKWVNDVELELAETFGVDEFDDIYEINSDEYMYESGYANGIRYACKQMRDKLND